MTTHDTAEQLWPPATYYQQIDQLRHAIGAPIFLTELRDTAINGSINYSGQPLILLSVIDYPQPNPYRQLCPHMLILDDGRGINMGRIVRISRNRAFGPAADDILFQNAELTANILQAPRTLSRQSIAATSRQLLSRMFGDEPGRLLQAAVDERAEHQTNTAPKRVTQSQTAAQPQTIAEPQPVDPSPRSS